MQNLDLKNIDKTTWQTFRFEEIAEKISKTVKPDEADVDIYVGLEHIDANDLHIKRFGVPSDVKGGKLRCYPGDVIFGKRRAYQRKAAIVDFDGICSAHAFVFRAISEVIEPELFPFFLHSDQFMHRMVDISVGGLSPTINWGDLKNQEFLLPPKDQQKQMAELLWAMDDVIEKEKEVLKKLEENYISTIEKRLINKDSNKVYFSELLDVIRGVNFKPEDLLENYTEDSCIILRSNNIFKSEINYNDIRILSISKVKDLQILREGDFAICMSNGSKELVGKAAQFNGADEVVSIGSFCAGLRPKSKKNGTILKHLLHSLSYRYAIKRILSGSAINNLKPSDIEELFLRMNIDNNLNDLLNQLNSMSDNKSIIESKINSSQALQKSLINQIF
ncbi:restriction endonuclease subunit S [Ancylomarina sp. 16SWW S1-10-2]|uniref:restriction endonuclease subunit S n=1 Tax=Ancylomarina sp. 16SWW S1-10-2 TaxID=2499681 RepID=UPI001E5B20EC|nr:restriction endonuclease subunit S [Ancylomarina sp. 16SWW S1-10-2]